MPQLLPALAARAAVVATAAAAAALAAVLPTTTTTAAAPAPTITVTAPVMTTVAFAAPAAATAPRARATGVALGKIGAPYRWGAAGPSSFDCSGLVRWSFAQAGISLPRTSRAQSQVGTPVSKADLQPGDLVFFYRPVSHVAIYIGNGQVVHASTAGKPVTIAGLDAMPFSSARRL